MQREELEQRIDFWWRWFILQKWSKIYSSQKHEKLSHNFERQLMPSERQEKNEHPKKQSCIAKFRKTVFHVSWFCYCTKSTLGEVVDKKILKQNVYGKNAFNLRNGKINKGKNWSKVEEKAEKLPDWNLHYEQAVNYLFNLVPQNDFKGIIETLESSHHLSKFSRNKKGQTLLLAAASRSSLKMFRSLISLDLDINALDYVRLYFRRFVCVFNLRRLVVLWWTKSWIIWWSRFQKNRLTCFPCSKPDSVWSVLRTCRSLKVGFMKNWTWLISIATLSR